MAASSLEEAAVAMEEGEVEKGFDPMADAFFSSMNQYQNRDGEEVPAEYCDEVIDKEMEICPYYRYCFCSTYPLNKEEQNTRGQ